MFLPIQPRRAYCQGFWIGLCFVVGAAMVVAAAAADKPGWLMGIVVGVIAAAGVGYWVPDLVRRPYAAWSLATEAYARIVRLLIKVICFFLVFVAVGRGGSELVLDRKSTRGSMWVPRGVTPREHFAQDYEGAGDNSSERAWIGSYIRWAKNSGNLWAVMLLPFLVLLSVFEPEEERSFPDNIYTLF